MQKPSTQDYKRLSFVAFSALFLFSLLIIQFYRMQIVEGDKWKKVAARQHHLVVKEPFKRGLFYSNTALKKGHPEEAKAFVIDVPKFHLFADPKAIPEAYRDHVAESIGKLLHLSTQEALKVRAQFEKKSRSRKLVLWLSPELQEKILAWWSPFALSKKIPRNALFFVKDYKRSYPYGKLLGQVLHTIREEKETSTQQSIPTGGLEQTLNSFLKGKEGRREILRSPRHPLDVGEVTVLPENGCDVYLTINHTLQAIAEEEIEKAVKEAGAKGGWAILMDPKTGDILALAQYPFFEPASYRSYFNNEKQKENTQVKAIVDPFEPGSTMKPITLAIGLKANEERKKEGRPPLFAPEDKVATHATHFPGRGSKLLKDTHTHAFLNMYLGLQKSSNVYMAKVIEKVTGALGDAWYRRELNETFGFGLKTGIELPGESGGLLPRPGKKHPNGTLEWSKATPFSLAMGHNVLANSLQMVRAYAIFANGGYLVQPTLIRKIVRKGLDGKEEVILQRKKEPKKVLELPIVQEVLKAMRYTTKPGGTATKADIPGYTEAGKTGTSEKVVGGVYSKKNHISTFIGIAPLNDPQIVLSVVIDEPEYKYIPGKGKNQMGGTCCAPFFREIGLRSLQYLGIPPDSKDKEDWMEETKALKEIYTRWNHP